MIEPLIPSMGTEGQWELLLNSSPEMDFHQSRLSYKSSYLHVFRSNHPCNIWRDKQSQL